MKIPAPAFVEREWRRYGLQPLERLGFVVSAINLVGIGFMLSLGPASWRSSDLYSIIRHGPGGVRLAGCVFSALGSALLYVSVRDRLQPRRAIALVLAVITMAGSVATNDG